MKYAFDDYNYIVRLDAGEKLVEALKQFSAQAKVDGAQCSGIGAAASVTLGFYQMSLRAFKQRTISQTLEVVSLTGSIAVDEHGETELHVHGVFADDEFHTYGGHVIDLIVGATVEIFVHRTYSPIRRRFDEPTGLSLLDLQD